LWYNICIKVRKEWSNKYMSKLNLVKAKGVTISLGGKDIELVYDFNAFAELEEKFGSVQKAFEAMSVNARMIDILNIIKAGMASSDVDISTKELGSYLTPRNITQLVEVITDALTSSLPENTEKAPKSGKN
jgi:hypothetical protein